MNNKIILLVLFSSVCLFMTGCAETTLLKVSINTDSNILKASIKYEGDQGGADKLIKDGYQKINFSLQGNQNVSTVLTEDAAKKASILFYDGIFMFYNDGKVVDLEKGYVEKNKLAGMYYGWSFMGKESINVELPMNKIDSPNRISGMIMLTQAYFPKAGVNTIFSEDKYEIKAYYLKVKNVISRGSNNWDLVFEVPENIANINISKDSNEWPSATEKTKGNIISRFTVK